MKKLEQIEHDVRGLSSGELAEFRRWFATYDAEAWDREFELGVQAGRLDQLGQQALAEHSAKRTREIGIAG